MIAARAEGRRRAGFTLIEIMAGVAIFLISVVSIMSLFGVAIDAHKGQVDRSTAAIVAQRAFSHFRAFPPSDIHPSPTPEPWVLELAARAEKDSTEILLSLPPEKVQTLARTLAIATDSGVFWQPAYGRPARALIEDNDGKNTKEWISFDNFSDSPSTSTRLLLGVTRGLFKSDPIRHVASPRPATVRLSFYFPDYPRYSFLLRTRRYSIDTPPLHDPAGDVRFDFLDVTVFWNEVGRAQQETFSFALSDRTQFDLTGTGVSFPPP
jgi:type II secretory pathway pseudopilin PulG